MTTQLLEQLKNSNPALRRAALMQLKNSPENLQAVEAIVSTLGDPNKGVQNLAVEVLSSMPHENTVNSLIPSIKVSDLNIRNAAMTILRNLASVSVPPLLKDLYSTQDVDGIIQNLVILGDIRSNLVSKDVLKFVTHEDDNVKITAVESLGKIQDPSIVDELMKVYESIGVLKYSIVETLGNIGITKAMPILTSALNSEDILEYFTAIGALGNLQSPEGIDILFNTLKKEEDDGTKRLIIKSLSQIEEANPKSILKLDTTVLKPIIMDLLQQEDVAEYVSLLKLATAISDIDFVKPFLNALENSDLTISQTAFNSLVSLGSSVVKFCLEKIGKVEPPIAIKLLKILSLFPSQEIPPVVAMFTQNPDDTLRYELTKILGANPSDISFESMLYLLEDPDEGVRRSAVQNMVSMLEYDGALTALIKRLTDLNGHVRREAALALSNSNSPQIIEPLFKVLSKDLYGDVREAAAGVLATKTDPDILQRLLEMLNSDNSRVRETVSKTIWKCKSTLAIDPLITRLADPEWRVIVNSCKSLEMLKGIKSIYPLKELLKSEDWKIRIAALASLRAFKSKELQQFFLPAINDDNAKVAKLAVLALADLEDRNFEGIFIDNLNHKYWEVKYQIIQALAALKSSTAIKPLLQIVESDDSQAVVCAAVSALSQLDYNDEHTNIVNLLDSNNRDLKIAAIKFFVNLPTLSDTITDKITSSFRSDRWLKTFFVDSFPQNKSNLLEKILLPILSPRETKTMLAATELEGLSSMTLEQSILISEIIAEKSGIEITDPKLLEKNLSKNLGRFFIDSWTEYYHFIRNASTEDDEILKTLYDSITDPKTEFFADTDQQKILTKTILPQIIEENSKNSPDKEIKILSCGCSYGPETYSIAMSILEDVRHDEAKISITGIDISHICLNTAKTGCYKTEMFRQVDQKYIDLYLEDDRGDLRICDKVKNIVDFKFANAVNPDSIGAIGEFDIVICRNLLSYQSQKGKEKLIENIYNLLLPGGVLLISSDESLYDVSKAFKLQTHEKVVLYKKL